MVNKKNSRVRVKDGKVTINKANVVKTDIMTSNGIIHVIDGVLTPPKTATEASAEGIIVRGIKMGVPHFNHGNHSALSLIHISEPTRPY